MAEHDKYLFTLGQMEGYTLNKPKPVSEWRKEIELVLENKKNEFHMLGHDNTTSDDIWDCLIAVVWKESNPSMRLYEVVADVLQLQITTYMTYLTRGIYEENDDLLASIEALRDD